MPAVSWIVTASVLAQDEQSGRALAAALSSAAAVRGQLIPGRMAERECLCVIRHTACSPLAQTKLVSHDLQMAQLSAAVQAASFSTASVSLIATSVSIAGSSGANGTAVVTTVDNATPLIGAGCGDSVTEHSGV